MTTMILEHYFLLHLQLYRLLAMSLQLLLQLWLALADLQQL